MRDKIKNEEAFKCFLFCLSCFSLRCSCLGPGRGDSQSLVATPPLHSMTRVRDFVADLAKTGKSFKEIKEIVDSVYGDKTLKKTAIYAILKKVKAGETTADQRHLNPKKRTRVPDVIASVAAAVEEDRRVTIKSIALANGVSVKTVHDILHKDLGLVKKSARWGAKTSECRPEKGEGADLPEVLGGGPAAVYGNAGQHCHYG